MSKHNYSQYSNKKYNNNFNTTPETTEANQIVVENQNGVAEEVEAPVTETNVATNEAYAVAETEAAPAPETNSGAIAKGVVTNCAKLNVRSKPSINGNVIAVLSADDEISIDIDESTEEWYKISTVNGVKGYCMRKFVSANI